MAAEEQEHTPQENISQTPGDAEIFADEIEQDSLIDEIPETPADSELSADQTDQDALEDDHPDIPTDSELFTDDVQEELSERQVFAGDDDFYKSLAESTKSLDASIALRSRAKLKTLRARFSTTQKILVAGFVTIAAMLLYAFLRPSPGRSGAPQGAAPQTASTRQPGGYESPDANTVQAAAKQIHPPQPVLQSTQALSLKVAEDLLDQKKYDEAYESYNKLYQILPTRRILRANMENHRDFLQLKMALCLVKSGNPDRANRLLEEVSTSRSTIVRLMANYHRASLAMHKRQYLEARTRAYQAIALADAVDSDKNLSASLRSKCSFLVAEAMTRNILSLSDADAELPAGQPGGWYPLDPFAGLTNEQLENLLGSGSDYLDAGLLGPQIRKIEHGDGLPRWSVVCNGASIDELLARFAANARMDITWDFQDNQKGQDALRKRPVILYMSEATTQQFVAAAAGQVGLLARMPKDDVVSIVHPDKYSSLSEHLSMLNSETISLWRRFALVFHDDRRTADAHFALGLLHWLRGGTPEAIAEYKMVANRYSSSHLAPHALFASSKLKSGLRDHAGASANLKQLVEQYPDSRITPTVRIHLAEHTAKAGNKREAARLYRKVYNFALSPDSQRKAAFGAGKCSYDIEEYEDAAKWLAQYIQLSAGHKNKELWSAYFLLGKTYLALAEPVQACRAFQHALTGKLSNEDYVETVSALVEGYVDRKQFVDALHILEDIDTWQFSEKQVVTILLLKSKVFQLMSLVDKAVAELGDKADYISDPQLKGEIAFELAKCRIAKGQLDLAHNELSKILPAVQPGPLAHNIALKLAEVCLSLGRSSQTIAVCSQIVDSSAPEQIKLKAKKILAAVYDRKKEYDAAVLALLDPSR